MKDLSSCNSSNGGNYYTCVLYGIVLLLFIPFRNSSSPSAEYICSVYIFNVIIDKMMMMTMMMLMMVLMMVVVVMMIMMMLARTCQATIKDECAFRSSGNNIN